MADETRHREMAAELTMLTGVEAVAPQLAEFRDQLRATLARAHALAEPMSQELFNRRPASGGWPVAQVLHHLAVTARAYLREMTPAIRAARERGLLGLTPAPYGLLGRWFVRFQEPPPRLRVPTFKPFEPSVASLTVREVLAELDAAHTELEGQMRAASGLDLRRVIVRSPVTPLFRLNVAAVFAMLAAHERRHLWQATRLRDAFEGQ